mgnify:CR=1 FL=1
MPTDTTEAVFEAWTGRFLKGSVGLCTSNDGVVKEVSVNSQAIKFSGNSTFSIQISRFKPDYFCGKAVVKALDGEIGSDFSFDSDIVLMTPDGKGSVWKDGEAEVESRFRPVVGTDCQRIAIERNRP